MKRRRFDAAFLLFTATLLALALTIQRIPVGKAGEITDVTTPEPGLIRVLGGETVNLEFGANISDATQLMVIIDVNFSDIGFTYEGFEATMNETDVSDQFDVSLKAGRVTINCESLSPANGSIHITMIFMAGAEEGNYTFEWRSFYTAYQEPPNMPTIRDERGTTQVEVTVLKVVIDDGFVSDDRCDVGSTQTFGFHASWPNGTDVTEGVIDVTASFDDGQRIETYSLELNSSGWAVGSIGSDNVTCVDFSVSSVNCSGITLYEQEVVNLQIIWDMVDIYEGGVTPSPAIVGRNCTLWFKARYSYDHREFNYSTGMLYVNGSACIWSITRDRWEFNVSSTTTGNSTYQISDITDTEYGLTGFRDLVSPILVVFTKPTSISIGSAIIPPGASVEIPVNLSQVSKIAGVGFDLYWNTTVIDVDEIRLSEFLSPSVNSLTVHINEAEGKATVALVNTEDPNYLTWEEERTILIVRVTATGPPCSFSPLDLENVEVTDAETWNPIPVPYVEDGNITLLCRGRIEGYVRYHYNGAPMEGAFVELWRGDEKIGIAVTDENGWYELPNLDAGTYMLIAGHERIRINTQYMTFWNSSVTINVTAGETVVVNFTLLIRGDLNDNGRVDIGDVAKIANMYVGNVPEEVTITDFNGNGRLDIGDVAKLANFYVGNVEEV